MNFIFSQNVLSNVHVYYEEKMFKVTTSHAYLCMLFVKAIPSMNLHIKAKATRVALCINFKEEMFSSYLLLQFPI